MLELKNGQVLTGKYSGGTAGTICLETASGIQVVQTGQAKTLTFAGGGPAATAPPTPTRAPAPAPARPSAVSVAAGTTLLVRMLDGASSSDAKGKRFTTMLETDLVAGGLMVARAGTKAYGRVYRKDLGAKTDKIAGKMKDYDPDDSWRASPD